MGFGVVIGWWLGWEAWLREILKVRTKVVGDRDGEAQKALKRSRANMKIKEKEKQSKILEK